MIASAVRVVLVAFTAGAFPATSAAQQHEGTTIAAVTVTGLRHIKESVVLEQIESRPGRPYSQAVADLDRVRLDRLGVFSDITMTPVTTGDALSVNVVVVETLRVLPAVSIAVTDENGTSAGPALKLLSVRGHPHEVSLTARFGGSTLFEFSETSARAHPFAALAQLQAGAPGALQQARRIQRKFDRSRYANRPANVRAIQSRRDGPAVPGAGGSERRDVVTG